MYKKIKGIFIILGIILFSLILSSHLMKINDYHQISELNGVPKSSQIHDPIIILGNNNFTSQNGVSSGVGTENNPFIIKDLIIETNGTEIGIFINNTNAFFIIQNCTLIYKGNQPIPPNLIQLLNVSNGNLSDNTIQGGKIFLSYSHNNLIFNNSLYRNSGIILSSSNNNNISSNKLNDCEFISYFSNNILISRNHIFNTSIGIEINGNINATIRENVIHNCTQFGISIYFKSNNTRIIDNYIYFFGLNATDIEPGWEDEVYLEGNIYSEPNGNGNGPFIPDLGPIIILSVIIGGIVGVIILMGSIIYRRRLAKSYAPPDLSE